MRIKIRKRIKSKIKMKRRRTVFGWE